MTMAGTKDRQCDNVMIVDINKTPCNLVHNSYLIHFDDAIILTSQR